MNKVLFCGPQYLNFDENTGGVYREMKLREKALEKHGWKVEYLHIDKIPNWDEIKVAHIFMANESTYSLVKKLKEKTKVVVSPIIDRQEGIYSLKALIWSMGLIPKMHSNLTRMKSICSEADAIIVRSNEELEKLNYCFGIDAGDIIKLPYEQISSDLYRNKEKQVLFVGDLSNPRKNVILLLDACSQLKIKLILAGTLGNDDYSKRISKKIKESPLTEYLGLISNTKKFELLKNSKVFCLPSLMEGIGISALEALDFNCKVVITEKGGVYDYFANNAEYINPKSLQSIKNGISKVIDMEVDTNPEKFKHLSLVEIGKLQVNLYKRVINQ